MPYCERCGAELDENAKYCPSCGTPVGIPQIRMEREGRMPSVARILLLIFGSIVLLVGIALLVGGGALLAVNTGLTDSEGFIATKSYGLERDSYAIVSQPINIDVGEIAGEWGVWRPSPGDFVTIRLTASSNDPSKNIFIGIAPAENVQSYLLDVYYHEVTRFSVSPSRDLTVEYTTHPGDSITSDPASQTFWRVSQHGTGTQTLDWAPEAGNYWIVLMNEDGSAGVDSTITLGVKIPLLLTIGLALFGGGVTALVIGAVMIYFGARR
jgi:hypothetical protein